MGTGKQITGLPRQTHPNRRSFGEARQCGGTPHPGLAAVTATLPRLMGFANEPEAKVFGALALAETVVAGITDFKHYERGVG